MSNQYIYLSCDVEGCDAFESLYVGLVSTENFDNNEWHGETITTTCRKHAEDKP